jgi:hypothetical protein
VDALEFGELGLVVDAEGFLEGVGLGGDHLDALGHRHRDDVGEVVLALGVVVFKVGEPVAQALDRGGEDAGVHFP